MADSLIRCADGCGAVLSWARLMEGARADGHILRAMRGGRIMNGIAETLQLPPERANDFVQRGVEWVMKGDASAASPKPRSP